MSDKRIRITDVGPRDGLQNEARHVPTAAKVRFAEGLAAAGVTQIEVGAFVHPRAVPAMADTEAVFRDLKRLPGVRYLALVPNLRGYERARSVGCDAIALFTAVSDDFTRKNIRMSVAESFAAFAPVAAAAARDGVALRGYVSTVFACPYAGRIAPERVVEITQRMLDLGCYEVSLGDTIGVGTPTDTRRLLDALAPAVDVSGVVMHFHDTWGMGVANAVASLGYGVRGFDASAGGLGGCPYAPGATGNVATEDLLYALHADGWDTGIDIEAVVDAAAPLAGLVGRELPGRVHHAVLARRERAGVSGKPAGAGPGASG